jgi:signal transduction histidine kinase
MAEPERPLVGRLRIAQWFAVLAALGLTVAVAGIGFGALAISNLADARERLRDTLDPAAVQSERLLSALVEEETGLRGFQLSGDPTFLEPLRAGRRRAQASERELRRRLAGEPQIAAAVDDARAAADRWRTTYADPAIVDARAGRAVRDPRGGKALFDAFRARQAAAARLLAAARARAGEDRDTAARRLSTWFIVVAVAVLVLLVVLRFALRRTVTKPVEALAGQVRAVREGDFDRRVTVVGPRDVMALADDVDAMRARIVEELRAGDQQRTELARSNAELEQFAYVASHDLQEPLRKVASFTQMLERRYAGQLDERADQYIFFAVDGAKRMQVLINDLLAFSRVGRLTGEFDEVDLDGCLAGALRNLESAIEESGAHVDADALPTVRGERGLLTAVFQNLVGNAVKFRGQAPPHVTIRVAERDGEHEISVADNGIGIDPEYAERIFVIFQRLHPKERYGGTGIGLAMCRKIIEHHGGRIWLDPDGGPGTTFRFTLPAGSGDDDPKEHPDGD